MLFYLCETKVSSQYAEPEDRRDKLDAAKKSRFKTEDFNLQYAGRYYGFIFRIADEKLRTCFAAFENPLTSREIEAFHALLNETGLSFSLKEITMTRYIECAEAASRSGFLDGTDEVFKELGIEDFAYRGNRNYTEKIMSKPATKAHLIKRANAVLCGETLIPEIERIFVGGRSNAKGHPVHYIIQSDDRQVASEIVEILLSALVANNRVISGRYINCKFDENDAVSHDYRKLCETASGGTIVVSCEGNDFGDGEFSGRGADIIVDVAEIARKCRNSLLTILCLPRVCDKTVNLFLENAGAISFVTIREQAVSDEVAKAYLKTLAKQAQTIPNRRLYQAIEPGKAYLSDDLRLIFEKWFDRHLKMSVYKQYQAFESSNARAAKAAPKGSAFNELRDMVGLAPAKEVILQALDFHKARKLFQDMDIDRARPAMHMVFTGNPGTAKTTVARLFARIMKENDLLSYGNLHEVGRADLVDRYVGGTAPRVKSHFRKANGSVLFIDEAYSLVDDRDGLFGDEAINTIVQEMENARDDMIVIFAGYPDKMEWFLSKNPGLRSRIAFHVNFDDYTADELYEILESIAKKHKTRLDTGVKEKVAPILENAVKTADFGNGRFVRNLFEKAQLKQAGRLVKMNVDKIAQHDVMTLTGDDFETPAALKSKETKRIGFV